MPQPPRVISSERQRALTRRERERQQAEAIRRKRARQARGTKVGNVRLHKGYVGYFGPIPHGAIRLSCSSPPVTITMLQGMEAPTLTAGWGGWELTQRPRDKAITQWTGTEPLQMRVTAMFDGFPSNDAIEPAIRALLDIAKGTDDDQPGTVTLDGIADYGVDEWAIEDLEFGTPILRRDGVKMRQPIVITLREYVPPEFAPVKSGRITSTRVKIYKIKKGDTPVKIARKLKLKKPEKAWTEIRNLNRRVIKSANQALDKKPGLGKEIRVPVSQAQPKGPKAKTKTGRNQSSRNGRDR